MKLHLFLTAPFSLILRSSLSKNAYIRHALRAIYFTYKKFEDPHRSLMRKYPQLFNDGHIIDIGANIGFTSIAFAHVIHQPYQVHAFEPDPRNYSLLIESIQAYNFSQKIRTNQLGAGECNQSAQLLINNLHHADHKIFVKNITKDGNEVIPITIISIDDYTSKIIKNEQITFVKIDVQGYELAILKGMEQVIKEHSSLSISMEFSPENLIELEFDPRELLTFLQSRNFNVYTLTKNGRLILDSYESLATRKIKGTYNLVFIPNTINIA